MTPLAENERLRALNPAIRADLAQSYGWPHEGQSAAVTLLSTRAVLHKHSPAFRRLQRHMARTWLHELVLRLRGRG